MRCILCTEVLEDCAIFCAVHSALRLHAPRLDKAMQRHLTCVIKYCLHYITRITELSLTLPPWNQQ